MTKVLTFCVLLTLRYRESHIIGPSNIKLINNILIIRVKVIRGGNCYKLTQKGANSAFFLFKYFLLSDTGLAHLMRVSDNKTLVTLL